MLKRKIKNLISNRTSNVYKTLNVIEISRSRLLHNFSYIQKYNPSFSIIPVLKANAYGHGLIQGTEILNNANCDFLAVDGYFEASKILDLTKHRILVLGYINPDNFYLLNNKRCSYVIQDINSLQKLASLNKPFNIHIELNTGMNRLGLSESEIDEYLSVLKQYPRLNLEGIMTHLADADNELDNTYTDSQMKIFDTCVERIIGEGFSPRFFHIAQTAGSVKAKSKYANSIRLGIGLYGVNPLNPNDKEFGELSDLKPILEFKSTIIKTIRLKSGDRVSYNGIFKAPKDMTIGVLPLGYYEGIPRELSNTGTISFNGHNLPIVGRVCMNHIMFDTKDLPVKVGDTAIIISSNIDDANSIYNICQNNNLFNYSLMTGLSESTRRVISE